MLSVASWPLVVCVLAHESQCAAFATCSHLYRRRFWREGRGKASAQLSLSGVLCMPTTSSCLLINRMRLRRAALWLLLFERKKRRQRTCWSAHLFRLPEHHKRLCAGGLAPTMMSVSGDLSDTSCLLDQHWLRAFPEIGLVARKQQFKLKHMKTDTKCSRERRSRQNLLVILGFDIFQIRETSKN